MSGVGDVHAGSQQGATVDAFATFLNNVLNHVEPIKPSGSIDPPLSKPDFGSILSDADALFPSSRTDAAESDSADKLRHYAIIETAVRDLFSNLIAVTSIDSPAFVRVWNLFDLLAILSDDGRCDPALLFWLIEELLDSQTIPRCRKIFDFLESRRERITAKNFKQKQLVILRSCNELLRRLSRAEDAAFCGRVFVFLFQSFPLGDKSSVNLRGEYHVENVTVFDKADVSNTAESMDVDNETHASNDTGKAAAATQDDGVLSSEALYPIFWSLQENFSQPKKLFDSPRFAEFRQGLEATMKKFRSMREGDGARTTSSSTPDSVLKTHAKRKIVDREADETADRFNPKYLTSRDLFDLEISDLSFQRHVLVQALIIMDFLLSLTTKAKEKLATVNIRQPNKSVMYADQVLSEEDTKWATEMKRAIADYLRLGAEGPYFYRMVETVLSRDKNWVRWKIENCPSIELPPVSAEEFTEAKRSVQRMTTNKRLRPTPMGSLSLSFLEDDAKRGLEKLKDPQRYQLPDLATFRRKIADEDFEIEMPTNNQTKQAAITRKASLSWRALRIASRTRLTRFDKIEDPDNIEAIFDVEKRPDDEEGAEAEAVEIGTETEATGMSRDEEGSAEKVGESGSVEESVAEDTIIVGTPAANGTEGTNSVALSPDGDAVMGDAKAT